MKLKPYTLNNLQLRNVEIEPVYEGNVLRSIFIRADGEELVIKAGDYGSQLIALTRDYTSAQPIQRSLRQLELRPSEPMAGETPATIEDGIPF